MWQLVGGRDLQVNRIFRCLELSADLATGMFTTTHNYRIIESHVEEERIEDEYMCSSYTRFLHS